MTPQAWKKVVDDLIEGGEIEKTGQKRGTRYRYVDAPVPEPTPVDATADYSDSDETEAERYGAVLDYLADHPGWHARSEVLAEVELMDAEWTQAIADLVEAGEVEKKGEKRGTRYRLKGDVGQLVVSWMSERPV